MDGEDEVASVAAVWRTGVCVCVCERKRENRDLYWMDALVYISNR